MHYSRFEWDVKVFRMASKSLKTLSGKQGEKNGFKGASLMLSKMLSSV